MGSYYTDVCHALNSIALTAVQTSSLAICACQAMDYQALTALFAILLV